MRRCDYIYYAPKFLFITGTSFVVDGKITFAIKYLVWFNVP